METEADVPKGFCVKIPLGGDFLLVGDLSHLCISSQRNLNGFGWRVRDDLPLSLAHEEALHHGGPSGIVRA